MRRPSIVAAVGVALAVGVVTVGTAAWAAIPDSRTGKITACVVKKGPRAGALRVIDAQRNERCLKSERTISWTSQAPRFRGEYRSGVVYRRDDVVTRGGSTYIATVKAKVALTSAPPGAGWTVLAQRGATGATGAAGPAGAPGLTGGTPAVVGANTISPIGASGPILQETSITVGVDGLPVVAYVGSDLRLAICTSADCSTMLTRTIDGASTAYASVAIGSDGNPIVSYQVSSANDLRVAHCSDPTCASSTVTTLDSVGNTGFFTSLAIGADGLPVIAHHYNNTGDLRITRCTIVDCTSSTTHTVASTNAVGAFAAVVIGADGIPGVAHLDETNLDLVFTRCTTAACTAGTTEIVDATNDTGWDASVVLGVEGHPVIAYKNETTDDLRVARCLDAACADATLHTLDSVGNVGDDTSIVLGADGRPVITYRATSPTVGLRLARCTTPLCTEADVIPTLAETASGLRSAVVLAPSGWPILSFANDGDTRIDVLVCGSASCNPWFRPGR